MARSSEALSGHVFAGERAAGQGTITGTDARACFWRFGVDGDGVGCAIGILVVCHHLWEVEFGGE